eukprot:CAMPEP_0203808676 /NCGR_PEP_ID=MMETSP0115-20131106/1748_1 /ASSEMBLY_ACC=CAM_ASM_000227 /TAXON_ID=33651 /ORGANISM="Bicosoecid sp, Strain ms1" /LENGTH=1095 /DNA_ID=CAMNT_0050717369 /DNA_START=49 /DNA_END=3336 /DNA_ORIENTATION=-
MAAQAAASAAASAAMAAATQAASKLGSGDAHFFEESATPEKIKKLLNNPSSGQVGVMEKTDGMKYLLAQMSKGRNVAEYFPDVVKNVIMKSVELKKMVYMYLVHHADANDECRELALLAINSFQRDLADPNQLIRSMALRVMTSIRVRDIVQLQIMAISKCATDSSPYVRKTAAHSLPKIFALAPDVKSELTEIIAKLLRDTAVMVVGSAVAAYWEVCPNNFELIHEHFRKLCAMLADIDEWGQVQIMTMLMRYARTQFLEPLARDGTNASSKPAAAAARGGAGGRGFYSSGSESEEEEEAPKEEEKPAGDRFALDDDHLLLLRSTLGLLSSRSPAVVLAVAAMHFYVGRPERDSPANIAIGKALVRVLRSPRETQYLVLANIATMSEDRPQLFEREHHHFYVYVGEPDFLRLQKLQILSNIACDDNVAKILGEMESYVRDHDKGFVRAAIRCVGRIASRLPDYADRCLRGLMGLVVSQYEDVVAEAVVVIRQLLQRHPEHDDVILKLVRKLEHTRVAAARAAIVWILGEFQNKSSIAPLAPDALRKLAKSFRDEEVVVKTQILNLAVKMSLQRPASEPVRLLMQYVLDLAKYDVNYDLRDRARVLRALMLGDAAMQDRARAILLAVKPPPAPAHNASPGLPGVSVGLPELVMGSLSHVVGHTVKGYQPLTSWQDVQPDKTARDPKKSEEEIRAEKRAKKKAEKAEKSGKPPKKAKGFYDSTDSEEEEESESESSTDSSDSDSTSSGSSSGSSSDSSSDEGSSSDEEGGTAQKGKAGSGSGSSSSGSSSGSGSDDSDEEAPAVSATPAAAVRPPAVSALSGDSGAIFDLHQSDSPQVGGGGAGFDFGGGGGGAGGVDFSTPTAEPVEVLGHVGSGGLQVDAVYRREPSPKGADWIAVELRLSNRKDDVTFENIRVGSTALGGEQEIEVFEPVEELGPGGVVAVTLQAKFDGRVPLKFELATDSGAHPIRLSPTTGELCRPSDAVLTESDFDDKCRSLGGMQQHTTEFEVGGADKLGALDGALRAALNLSRVGSDTVAGTGIARFAGSVRNGGGAVYVTVSADAGAGTGSIKVNCDDVVFGGGLQDAVKAAVVAAM